MKLVSILLILLIPGYKGMTQKIPYDAIPAAPEQYDVGTVLARMTDGLGYRYYWATADLRDADLNYIPSEGSRSTLETMEHIHSLVIVIHNTLTGEPNIRPEKPFGLNYEALRSSTLELLKLCSDKMKETKDYNSLPVVFKMGDRESSLPFWNIINGPLSDAIYHTGQIVSFRRASGNPINPGVNVFTGRTADQ